MQISSLWMQYKNAAMCFEAKVADIPLLAQDEMSGGRCYGDIICHKHCTKKRRWLLSMKFKY